MNWVAILLCMRYWSVGFSYLSVRCAVLQPEACASLLQQWRSDSIRQCQLLISSGTPTALPGYIHKNTKHIRAEAVTLRAVRYMGMWRCNSTHFTLNTGWSELLFHAPAALLRKKSPRYLITGRLSGLQSWSRCYRKEADLFPLSELEHWVVSLTAWLSWPLSCSF
jgi:hypothetical protein